MIVLGGFQKTLFTREDLFGILPLLQIGWRPVPSMTIRRYWQASSEEHLEVHLCRLEDADSACHFWIESVRNTSEPPIYIELLHHRHSEELRHVPHEWLGGVNE